MVDYNSQGQRSSKGISLSPYSIISHAGDIFIDSRNDNNHPRDFWDDDPKALFWGFSNGSKFVQTQPIHW